MDILINLKNFKEKLNELFGDKNLTPEEKYKIYRKHQFELFDLYEKAYEEDLIRRCK